MASFCFDSRRSSLTFIDLDVASEHRHHYRHLSISRHSPQAIIAKSLLFHMLLRFQPAFIEHLSSIYRNCRKPIVNRTNKCLSKVYRASIEHLSNVNRTSIGQPSNIYRKHVDHLSNTYRTPIIDEQSTNNRRTIDYVYRVSIKHLSNFYRALIETLLRNAPTQPSEI